MRCKNTTKRSSRFQIRSVKSWSGENQLLSIIIDTLNLRPVDLRMTDRRKTQSAATFERRKRNRRSSPRWLLNFEVCLYWEGQSVACRAYEIGTGGLSLTCERQLPSETEILVEYRLDCEAAPVKVKGTIRHVDGVRVGIEFLSLGMKDRLALVDYCEKLEMA